jgi:hypothetical protein
MTPNGKIGLPPWQAGLLRATAFCSGPPDLNGVRWWQDLVGHPADSRNIRVGAGQLVEQGPIDNRILQLQIISARVDWLILPAESGGEAFPNIGPFERSASEFRTLISPWLAEAAPALNRLAFGAQLYIPCANLDEARGYVARLVPYVRINWTVIRDFSFQVNRPGGSRVWGDAGDLNRLARIQAVSRRAMVATVTSESQTIAPVSEEFAAFLELDISTPALQSGELPRDRFVDVFAELIANGIEIAERGIFDEHGN